jgi:hypothetical protein
MNKKLLQYLNQRYNKNASADEKPHISSHWEACLQRLNIQTDTDGKIISLTSKDTGLDTFERKNFLDYLLDSFGIFFHWLLLPKKIPLIRLTLAAIPVCKAMRRPFNFDVFRQLYCLEIIESRTPKDKPCRILMIGDGYGVLSAIFKSVFPHSSLCLVDLGKTLLLQAHHCQLAHPGKLHKLFNEVTREEFADFVYCPAEFLESLSEFRFDIAVNIVSFHEMPADEIKRYFFFLRKTLREENLFYCCNREYKKLSGGEMVRFSSYPWKEKDAVLLDELCPWHQYFFNRSSSYGTPRVSSYENRKLGFGKIRHRLAILSLEKA